MEINHEDLYSVRILVFIETEPQSNRYKQICFSPEKYSEVTKAISKGAVEVDTGLFEQQLPFSFETYTLPDLPDIYFPED